MPIRLRKGCERVAKGLRRGCAEVAFCVGSFVRVLGQGILPLFLGRVCSSLSRESSETPTEVQRELLSREMAKPRRSHDEATTKPRRSHDEATTKPRRSHDEATTKPLRSHYICNPVATRLQPVCNPFATLLQPSLSQIWPGDAFCEGFSYQSTDFAEIGKNNEKHFKAK